MSYELPDGYEEGINKMMTKNSIVQRGELPTESRNSASCIQTKCSVARSQDLATGTYFTQCVQKQIYFLEKEYIQNGPRKSSQPSVLHVSL